MINAIYSNTKLVSILSIMADTLNCDGTIKIISILWQIGAAERCAERCIGTLNRMTTLLGETA